MSSYAYRFVGQESLPSRLPDFDLEQFFQLTEVDVAAVTDRFRADRRVAGALQLFFLRAMGRPMSRFAVIPRNLLKYVTQALNALPLSIASLRSLYERLPTLYDHQGWAKKYLGIRDFDAQAEAAVVNMLSVRAAEASHTDDLVAAAVTERDPNRGRHLWPRRQGNAPRPRWRSESRNRRARAKRCHWGPFHGLDHSRR